MSALAKWRAVWFLLTSRNSILITFDDRRPATDLGHLVFNCWSQDAPNRLASACLVAHRYEQIITEEGQAAALATAAKILCNPKQK